MNRETPNIRRVTLQQKLTMKAMYDEGYTLQAIANYVGKSLTTVKRHIYKDRIVIVDDANLGAPKPVNMMMGVPSVGNTYHGAGKVASRARQEAIKARTIPAESEADKLIAQAKELLERGAWRRALHKLQQAEKISWSPDWM